MAMVEKITNVATIGRRRFQFTYLIYWNITTVAEVSESRPESVTASAYDGIRKGRAVIMNMPNPNPMVRCTKLAPAARRNIAMLNSITCVVPEKSAANL
jgi:hypothetical protein